MIKELKASSSLAAPILYIKTACSFTTTTFVLTACALTYASCEIIIKSGSETSEQHL